MTTMRVLMGPNSSMYMNIFLIFPLKDDERGHSLNCAVIFQGDHFTLLTLIINKIPILFSSFQLHYARDPEVVWQRRGGDLNP